MKELEEMTRDELRELSIKANKMADAENQRKWDEANAFWDNFADEYEFRATVIPLSTVLMTAGKERGVPYFRDKLIDKAVRVEARYTEDTIKRANEGYRRLEGRAYGNTIEKYIENKWQGMTYLLVEGKVVMTTGGGSVWASISWRDSGWSDKETHLKRFQRILNMEEWLAENPDREDVMYWTEFDPWKK